MTMIGELRPGGRREYAAPRAYEDREAETASNSTVARWEGNVLALRTLKELEREGRGATQREREILKRFAGFGDTDFNRAFQWTSVRDGGRPELSYAGEERWAKRGDELRELLNDDEYKSIRQSRTTAFFTSPHIVDSMWQGLQSLGVGDLGNLRILEPSAGSGRFIERQPPALRERSQWTAVEKDSLTARLLRHSFGDVNVRHSPLEETILPDDSYDVAISNVPFGSQGVHDPEYLRAGKAHLTRSLHNYFFAKALDKVRPGGIVAFVTSHHMMDSPRAETVRETLAEEADLLAAVRLPMGAFPDTKVVTDIIYLRKRLPGEAPGDKDWTKSEKVDLDGTEQRVNRYFVENPGQVLGTQTTARHGMRQAYEYTVLPDSANPVQGALGGATTRALGRAPAMSAAVPATAPSPSVQPAQPKRQAVRRDLSTEDAAIRESLASVRDLARRQVNLESGGAPGPEIEENRLQLQDAYLEHVTAHGALNTPLNYSLMAEDPDRAPLFALENYDKGSNCWRPASIMGHRSISAAGAVPALAGPSDALDYHLQMSGRLDFDEVGGLIGQDADAVRDSLAAMGRVYRLSEGGWTTAEDYLSGNVREKLRWAERAAATDPSFQANVQALREVQPPWVGGEDISVPLGSPWVPDRYVNQWIMERMGIQSLRRGYGTPADGDYFAYDPDFGRWRQRWQFPKDYRTLNANREWGTPKVSAQKIIEKMLTGGSLQIGETMSAEDVRFAQERVRALQEDWEGWLWSDHERTADLERRYNHTFNEYRPRSYRGKEYYPGMAVEWQQQLHPFQREGIQRIVVDGSTLLAHEVGFGKTASMVGSAMERQRLGLTEKPLFVIPKATHAQFQSDFMKMYPGARILAPEEGEFSTDNRERFLSRIATNDWDAVILTGEQFQAIPLSPQRERAWVASERAQLQAALENLENDESQDRDGETRSAPQKAVDTALDSLEKRLRDRLATIERDDAIYFDQLGVDMLYVDEADRYKNLPFRSGMGGRGGDNIKGMPSGESSRAWDMYTKIRYLQELPKPGPVVFATGTPISNTLAEAWTMMRYLNEPELRRQGLHHFDSWAKTFGNMSEDMELDAAGRYKMTKRFRDFVNKPELARMFQEVADIRVISETPTMQALRPGLAGGERHIVTSPRDPQLDAYMGLLRYRAENIPYPPGKGDDNMLKILTDGRKASMDLRLLEDEDGLGEAFNAPVGKDARPYPEGKLVQVARNVARIHETESPAKGAQLVFLDMGTPKAIKADDDKGDAKAEGAVAAQEAAIETGLYRVLKERITDQGVPAEQIAFIHDYPSDEQREDLFDSVRKGDIRVLIGSTEKMGVGVNVQNRAAALHHIDAPWRPRDIEQREGRVIRQGNKVYGPILDAEKNPIDPGRGVQIYQYVQKGGLDEFMWQMLEEKGRGIKGMMKRNIDPGERRVQDIDSLVLTAADTKAAAAANPLVKRNVELGHAIQELQSDRKAHQLRTKTAQQEVGAMQSAIENSRTVLPRLERDAAYLGTLPKDDKFQAAIGGRSYDKSSEAGEALASAIKKLPMDAGNAPQRPLGLFKGFEIGGNRLESGYRVVISRPDTNQPYSMDFASRDEILPEGIMRRINNRIAGIPEREAETREKLTAAERRLGSAQRESVEPWDRALELRQLRDEQASIQTRLKQGETGEEAGMVYGLKPLPVGPWTPAAVAAVERQIAGDDAAEAPQVKPSHTTAAVPVSEGPALRQPAAEEAREIKVPDTEPQAMPVIEVVAPSPALAALDLATAKDDLAQIEASTLWKALEQRGLRAQNVDEMSIIAYRDQLRTQVDETSEPEPPPTPASTPAQTPDFEPEIQKVTAAVAQDRSYRNAVANSDAQNSRIEHDKVFERAMVNLALENPAFYNRFTGDDGFRQELLNKSFAQTYTKADQQQETALQAQREEQLDMERLGIMAQPIPEPLPTPVQKGPEVIPGPRQPTPRESRREQRLALREEIERLGGVAPAGASIKELTPIRDGLLARAAAPQLAPEPEPTPVPVPEPVLVGVSLAAAPEPEPAPTPKAKLPSASETPLAEVPEPVAETPPAPRVDPVLTPEYQRRVTAGMKVESAKERLNRVRVEREELERNLASSQAPDERNRKFWLKDRKDTLNMLQDLEALSARERRRTTIKDSINQARARIVTADRTLANMEAGPEQQEQWRTSIAALKQTEAELGSVVEEKRAGLAEARQQEKEARGVPMPVGLASSGIVDAVAAGPAPTPKPTLAQGPTPGPAPELLPIGTVQDIEPPLKPERPKKSKAEPEPPSVPCLPALSENTLESLQGELSAQKADLEKAQRSKGNTGGLPKMVRVNLAERAVGKVERKLRSEEKRLAACVVATGVKATATARIPAVPKANRPKARTKKPHPMVTLRRAVQSAQRRGH